MSKVAKAIKNIFKAPKMPEIDIPSMPPAPDSPQAKLAAQKRLEGRKNLGRTGTIYSGQSYTGRNLGGTVAV